MTSPALRPLSAATWAWVQDRTDRTQWGFSNSGLVASEGQALLVDTQFTLGATRKLLDAVAAALPGTVIETVVSTHQNGDHTWGHQLVDGADIITSAASAEHQCMEMSPEQLTALSRSAAADAVTSYVVEHFGRFDFSGVQVVAPTRTFTGREEVTVGSVAVELIDLGPGHSAGDVAVHVPGDGTVFAGDCLFDGGHMIVWSGSLAQCIRSVDTLLDTGAHTFVPGHGDIMDRDGVHAFRTYLVQIAEAAQAHATADVPLEHAAQRVHAEFAGELAHPERLFTAVAGAYADAGVPSAPSSTMELVSGMASLAALRTPRS